MKKIFLSITIIILFSSFSIADVVILKNGNKIEGRETRKGGKVIVEIENGFLEFPLDMVREIKEKETTLEIYFKRSKKLKDDDAKGHYELGVWCGTKGLKSKMVKQFKKVIVGVVTIIFEQKPAYFLHFQKSPE